MKERYIKMRAWKKHHVNKKYIDLVNRYQPCEHTATHSIHLLRKAIESIPEYEARSGVKASCIVVNETIFIRIDKYHISSITKHLRFDSGFIPLYRIKKVEVI